MAPVMIHDVIYGTANELRRSLTELWNPTSQTPHTNTDNHYDLTKQINYSNVDALKFFTSIRVLDTHLSKLA